MEIQAIRNTAIDLVTQIRKQVTMDSATGDKVGQSVAPRAGGVPPAGGGGAKPIESSDTSSSNSSSAKIYDKRDTNQDGVVSDQEALLFSLAHPANDTQGAATVSTSQLQTGLSAYQQAVQPDDSTTSSVLS